MCSLADVVYDARCNLLFSCDIYASTLYPALVILLRSSGAISPAVLDHLSKLIYTRNFHGTRSQVTTTRRTASTTSWHVIGSRLYRVREDKLYKTGEIRFRPSKITTVALEWPCIAAGEYTYASTTSQFFPLSVASSGPVAGKTLEAIRDMFCRSTDIIRSVRGYSPVRGCVVLDIHRHDLVEKGAATITDMQVPATARR